MMPYKKYIFRISPANMGMIFPKIPEILLLQTILYILKQISSCRYENAKQETKIYFFFIKYMISILSESIVPKNAE